MTSFDIITEIEDFMFSDKLKIENSSINDGRMALIDIFHKDYPYPNKRVNLSFGLPNNKFLLKKNNINSKNVHMHELPKLILNWMSFYIDDKQSANFIFTNCNGDGAINGLFSKTIWDKDNAVQYRYHSGTNKVAREEHGTIVNASMNRHRIGAPAVIDYACDGSVILETYCIDGKNHNDAGPAYTLYANSSLNISKVENYYINGQFIGENLGLYSKEAIQNFLLMQ